MKDSVNKGGEYSMKGKVICVTQESKIQWALQTVKPESQSQKADPVQHLEVVPVTYLMNFSQ